MAFVPAAQIYAVIDTTPQTCAFYQVVMPYDYMVLADSVCASTKFTESFRNEMKLIFPNQPLERISAGSATIMEFN